MKSQRLARILKMTEAPLSIAGYPLHSRNSA